MTSNYKFCKDGKWYNIIEIPTDLIVHRTKRPDDAVKYTVRLNKLKTGFQGFTPPFFAQKLQKD